MWLALDLEVVEPRNEHKGTNYEQQRQEHLSDAWQAGKIRIHRRVRSAPHIPDYAQTLEELKGLVDRVQLLPTPLKRCSNLSVVVCMPCLT